jgi:predicted aspartyl protease
MAMLTIPCSVFDPIRFTTSTKIRQFIVDTWFSHGLITRSLYKSLPGLETDGVGIVAMSSGMYTEQPKTNIGIQI